MSDDTDGTNKDVIDLLSRKNRENVFYIMGILERVYANCYKINDGEDAQENIDESIEYLNVLINFFYEFIKDEKTEEEFIRYVYDHFDLEVEKRKHSVEVNFEPKFEIKDNTDDNSPILLFPNKDDNDDKE